MNFHSRIQTKHFRILFLESIKIRAKALTDGASRNSRFEGREEEMIRKGGGNGEERSA